MSFTDYIGRYLSNTGQQAVTATAAALPNVSAGTVTLKNKVSSSGAVYIGLAGVTVNTGYELSPGDSIVMGIANLNEIFVVAAATGSTVCWTVALSS